MPTVLLVRHGQASFGAADYDVLSATGQKQSELVGEALSRAGVAPDRILAGTLRRQQDTAVAASALKIWAESPDLAAAVRSDWSISV